MSDKTQWCQYDGTLQRNGISYCISNTEYNSTVVVSRFTEIASMIPSTWDKDVDHLKQSQLFLPNLTVYINRFIFWFNSPVKYANLSGMQYRKKLHWGCNFIVIMWFVTQDCMHHYTFCFFTFCCSTLYAQFFSRIRSWNCNMVMR